MIPLLSRWVCARVGVQREDIDKFRLPMHVKESNDRRRSYVYAEDAAG